MRVVIRSTAEEVGEWAALAIHEGIESERVRVLGVATGSSPLPTYRCLRRRRTPAYERLTVFALDEYVDLPVDHPASYHRVIDQEVVAPLGLDPRRVHVPDGLATDQAEAAQKFEAQIRAAGGVDLQLLGIGSNGHIGFNEPPAPLGSRTGTRTLALKTRQDNARFFSSLADVPTQCVTQGIATILDARSVLLVATGGTKADAVARAIDGPVSSECPASALQLHPDATFVLDHLAAARLSVSSRGASSPRGLQIGPDE